MTSQLENPDLNRCQALVPNGASFMSFGGVPRRERCTNEPAYVATENQPGEDGLYGSMSLCEDCAGALVEQIGPEYATFHPVLEEPEYYGA